MTSKKETLGPGEKQGRFTIGRQAFEKISAVEGIRPSEASRARAGDFERKNLSAADRRREIIDAHRPKT